MHVVTMMKKTFWWGQFFFSLKPNFNETDLKINWFVCTCITSDVLNLAYDKIMLLALQ